MRVAAAALLMLLGQAVYRAALLLHARMWRHMPLPLLGPAAAPSARMMLLFGRWLYRGFVPRLNALSLGVLAALAASDLRVRQAMTR